MTLRIDPHWRNVSPEQRSEIAAAWLAEIGSSVQTTGWDLSATVACMNFLATPQVQWDFILRAVAIAETEVELAAIAAGPMEHLLRGFGDEYIDRFEEQVISDRKFFRALSGVRGKESMPAAVYSRISEIGAAVAYPLSDMAESEAHTFRIHSEKVVLERMKEIRREKAEVRANKGVIDHQHRRY